MNEKSFELASPQEEFPQTESTSGDFERNEKITALLDQVKQLEDKMKSMNKQIEDENAENDTLNSTSRMALDKGYAETAEQLTTLQLELIKLGAYK